MSLGQPGAYAAPPRRTNAWLLWLLGGCGVILIALFILAAIGAAKLGKLVAPVVSSATAGPACAQKLMAVRTAINGYAGDHGGAYPAKLTNLVPKYLPDTTDFSFRLASGQTVTLVYYPPRKDTPPTSVVAEFETGRNSMQIANQRMDFWHYIRLLKDGLIVQDQLQRNVMPNTGP